MDDKKSYYANELEQLKNSEYNKTINLSDKMGTNTKALDLNSESIPILIKWLEKELKRFI